jgi:hypothetical protein
MKDNRDCPLCHARMSVDTENFCNACSRVLPKIAPDGQTCLGGPLVTNGTGGKWTPSRATTASPTPRSHSIPILTPSR